MKSKILKTKLLGRSIEVFFHIILWVLYFLSINVFWTESWVIENFSPNSIAPHIAISMPIIFYLNALWLMPKYFNKKKWYYYIGYFFLFTLGFEIIRSVIFSLFLNGSSDFKATFMSQFSGSNSIMIGPFNVMLFNVVILSCIYRFVKDLLYNKSLIEKLQSEKLKMELALLKSQVNPHFLFNSLNTLDDLIDRNPTRAKSYLHKLSNMYRYSIKSMRDDVVSLQEEWNFVDDYIYLLKERFGDIYQFERTNDLDNLNAYLIPPAALQTLVENAVKHNFGCIEKPLTIDIKANENGLSVSHLKQLKPENSYNTGTGLKNIISRFNLLSNKDISIEDSTSFSVTIPLIKRV